MNIRDKFNRDGYAVLENRFPSETYLAWQRCIGNKSYLRGKLDSGVDNYSGYLRAKQKNVLLQQMILTIDLYSYLGFKEVSIIEQPIIHIMSPKLKISGGYYGTEAHQDWPSTQGSLDSITVWIALTDAGIGNFPLEVIPGSHKNGLLDGKLNGSVLEVECDEKDFIPIECKAGDVVFMSGFTVHRTGKGNGFRVAVSQRFDNAAEPTFIERGYPCAQKRVVDRDIKWRPTVEQVQKIFT